MHCESLVGQRWHCVMQTLTVAPGYKWEAGHIGSYIRRVRDWCKWQGVEFRFAWVAELQRRGAIHYHVMVWLPSRLQLPKADKRGWWSHGSTNTKRVYAPIKYAIKYTSKGSSDGQRLPRGCRVSGSGGLNGAQRLERAWWACPRWIRDQCTVDDRPGRAPGGGFLLRRTGEWFESPWVVAVSERGRVVISKRTCAVS